MKLPLPDRSFDLVLSIAALKLWPDPLQGIRELRRVCRPTGRVWMSRGRPGMLGGGRALVHVAVARRISGPAVVRRLGIPPFHCRTGRELRRFGRAVSQRRFRRGPRAPGSRLAAAHGRRRRGAVGEKHGAYERPPSLFVRSRCLLFSCLEESGFCHGMTPKLKNERQTNMTIIRRNEMREPSAPTAADRRGSGPQVWRKVFEIARNSRRQPRLLDAADGNLKDERRRAFAAFMWTFLILTIS